MSLIDDQRIYDTIIAHGATGDGEVKTFGEDMGIIAGRQYFSVGEMDWSGIRDPEHLGRDLADVLCDWFDIDTVDTVRDAWEAFEGDWCPEVLPEWWPEVEKGFIRAGEQTVEEWLAERRHGHPSLTAWERNSGGL